MFARFCFLSRRASQSGSAVGKGGFNEGVDPCNLHISLKICVYMCPQRVSLTHSEQFEAVEFLARDHGDELHFAEEADLRRREAGRKGEGHEVGWCIAGEDEAVSEKQRKVFSTRKFNITRSACWSWLKWCCIDQSGGARATFDFTHCMRVFHPAFVHDTTSISVLLAATRMLSWTTTWRPQSSRTLCLW